MDVDSPPERNHAASPRDAIIQRLVQYGVPQGCLDLLQPGLVGFVRENKSLLFNIVSLILPTDAEVSAAQKLPATESSGDQKSNSLKELFGESISWLKWLMFESEPETCLKDLAESSAGQRAVCGAVWGQNDLAYRCRTCEHDPTCAICVPCFQNGNHKDHDYSIMYTGGGCCDCGDVTAWKREGFCSMHKGTEQIRPLSNDLARSIGPVLDILLVCWKDKVWLGDHGRHQKEGGHSDAHGKVVNELSSVIIDMLLDFCLCSESLLSFISQRMLECVGFLDILVRAERSLDKEVIKKLHELLLKFLGEPIFKYEFAKAFIGYYPTIVKEIIKESRDSVVEKYPLLSMFSVQLFTVPTLTPRLVQEVNLPGILLGCLSDIFQSCVAEDGHLQASKLSNVFDTTIRVVEDFRYVLSHDEVLEYIIRERPDISRIWMKLLGLVQGMDAQKRLTGLHTEEENEILHTPFVLAHYIGNVNALLVDGAFTVAERGEVKGNTLFFFDAQGVDDTDRPRHAKVGRLSQESSVCNMGSRGASECSFISSDSVSDRCSCPSIPSSVLWLIFECLKTIEKWLEPESSSRSNALSLDAASSSGYNVMTIRKKVFKMNKGKHSNRVYRMSVSRDGLDEHIVNQSECRDGYRFVSSAWMGIGQVNNSGDSENHCVIEIPDEGLLEGNPGKETEESNMLSFADWPDILYDVSSQEISFHIPLHRLLSLLFRKAIRYCYAGMLESKSFSALLSPIHQHEFFGQILGGFHPFGFSTFIMEHPLRLRVYCAQVRAGMWRRNGDASMLNVEYYRSVRWFEQGLESDLFLLQCCAALAPPDMFLKRIEERFGLSYYMDLDLAEHNEYESVLVQEMLTLIIQIVKERRFCGFSTSENLQRELVCKLAIGDATHSQLAKSLPRDLSKSDELQKVLNILAKYSNPSGMKQGKYSLHKAYWKDLDLYHPRWSLRDMQVAEERYFRFCKVSALNAQLPRWTDIFSPLNSICRLATSKEVLRIVRAVLFHAYFQEFPSARHAPDGVLITALHLLSLGLDVCCKMNNGCRDTIMSTGDMSHHGTLASIVTADYAEDTFPLLKYACEEFDMDASDTSFSWKPQSMLSLLVSLRRKYKEENIENYAETRQCDIPALTENLLKKFAQLSISCMMQLKRLAPELTCCLSQQSANASVSSALASGSENHRAKARERQAAILEKMKAEQSKFLASMKAVGNEEFSDISKSRQGDAIAEVDRDSEESTPICSLCRGLDSRSPLCYLIFLQKSRLASIVERGPLSWEDAGQSNLDVPSSRKGGVGDPSSTSLMSLVHSVQSAGLEFTDDLDPVEVDAFFDFFGGKLPDIKSGQPTNLWRDTGTETSFVEMIESEIYQSLEGDIRSMSSSSRDGIQQNQSSFPLEVLKGSENSGSTVLEAYLTSLSRRTLKHQSSKHGISTESSVPFAARKEFGPKDCDGIHISSCGHAMHQDCHDRYLSSLKRRPIRRLGFELGYIVDPHMGELLCPVCRRLANSILPAFPGVLNKAWRHKLLADNGSLPSGVSSVTSDFDGTRLQLPPALSLLQRTANIVEQGRFLKTLSKKMGKTIASDLEPILQRLCILYYPHSYGSFSASGRLSHSLMLWDTLRYSLISAEIAARGRINKRPAGSNSRIEALYSELRSSNGFILALLFHVCQTNCSMNNLGVLLRFRAVQLLAGSICSGVTCDNSFVTTDKLRGTVSSILEFTDKGETFPDIVFWKRAADPILSHDPFSSLMWVLFSLPLPFLSSSERFIPLVHLFYVVCVVQALITCYSAQQFDVSGFDNGLLHDVCKTMAECEYMRSFFVSNYLDSSCHPKDMIRRFTFPYLRRCALLLKLIKSSMVGPLRDYSYGWEGSSLYGYNEAVDDIDPVTAELNGVRELEDLFQICSLEVVLKDEVAHSLALKWCGHFCEDFKVRKYGGMLYSTPAVPFKLLQLPQLYQELLQRYVKLQCFHCKSIPEEPALCLLCGKLCSPNWKACCRENRCLNHAMICGAGVGVFLLVRRTTILLQRSARQASWPSPYLDAFGEEDIDMHRGKPLYLNEERYSALAYLVASHSLDQNSEVLRHTTIGAFAAD